jgi:hypothetical protein
MLKIKNNFCQQGKKSQSSRSLQDEKVKKFSASDKEDEDEDDDTDETESTDEDELETITQTKKQTSSISKMFVK